MKIYAIHAGDQRWNPEISFFQSVMFHGEALHLPKRGVGSTSHFVGEPRMAPMQLIVNGFRLADVFIPSRSGNLVVSERVMTAIKPLQRNFEFLPVTFAKVFHLPWLLDGTTDSEVPAAAVPWVNAGREYSISSDYLHDPDLAATLPPYYEVVTHNHFSLLKRFPPTHQFFFKSYAKPLEGASDLLPVSQELFTEYPVTCSGFTVVREDVVDAMSPYMNRRYFGIKEFAFDGKS